MTITTFTFPFHVTETEVYTKRFEIQALTAEHAREILDSMLAETPLSQVKDTLTHSDSFVTPIPVLHTVESLFDIDAEDNDEEVILVKDLTEQQRRLLNLPKA